MALSGLEIYKLLPKTNCKECGFPTCLAFAMQIAAKKVSLDKCPYVNEEAKAKLESASRPPINLVTIGAGDKLLEVGNETVMFRHDETFYHPTGLGFLIEDTLSADEIGKKAEAINKLSFERVGQRIEVNLIALMNSSKNKDTFVNALKAILSKTQLAIVLMTFDGAIAQAAISLCKDKKPLLYAACKDNLDKMAKLAKDNSLPLAVRGHNLEELSELTTKLAQAGLNNLVIDSGAKNLPERLKDLTIIRKMALKKAYRPFGYPAIAFTASDDPYLEVSEAATYIVKYAGIVIMKSVESYKALALLTARQNIYTDPQKPLQVEPKVYEIGNVSEKSPILVTTNFSLTYYTVESEVEASKIPSYIVSVDSEGMSVLTAWAAEKFTAGKIAAALKSTDITKKVSHKNVIIPGYVAVLSGKLEEESGRKVIVGPREASGIPTFLKGLK